MNKKFFLMSVLGLIMVAALVISTRAAAQVGGLPDIRFEGQGPGTFTVEPPRMLFEKSRVNGELQFIVLDETSHYEDDDDPLFSTDFWPAEPVLIREGERTFGSVEAGCLVNYVQIKDDVDPDINTWYINDTAIEVVGQDWVSYGSFIVPESGELTIFSEDSSALIVEICVQVVETETPTATDESPTATATFTPTGVVATATFTATTTQVTPPGSTPTNTTTPVLGILPTVTNTPAATRTLIPTPNVIPSTGGGLGQREIAAIGLGLFLALGFLIYGWRRLLGVNR